MEDRASWLVEGLVTGLVGYFTVVVFFLITNLAAGHDPFHTPALLGSALFFGVREAASVLQGPAPIIAYNGVHMVVSVLIGLGAAWLVFQTEKNQPLWYVVFFIFLMGFIYSVVVMGVLASELAHLLSWSPILLANALAGIAAGGYLWRRHATLVRRASEEMTGEH